MYLTATAFILAGFLAGSRVASSSISTLGCDDLNHIVRNAADIEALSRCSILPGNIAISGPFSGAVSLPGISVIGNTLYTRGLHSLAEITELSLPDLQFVIEGMSFRNLPKLQTLSVPKLRSVGSGSQPGNPSPEITIITYYGEQVLNLSFPELESVSMTWFAGNIGSIDMPKLKVARDMWIDSTADYDCIALIAQLKDVDFRDGKLDCKSSGTVSGELSLGDIQSGAGEDQLPVGL